MEGGDNRRGGQGTGICCFFLSVGCTVRDGQKSCCLVSVPGVDIVTRWYGVKGKNIV